jgi:hypothetical protein
MRRVVVLAGVMLLGSAPLVAAADPVYRWSDASGAVSYGEKPPANAIKVRQLDVSQGTVASSNQDADQKLVDGYNKSRLQRLEQDTAEARLEAEKAKADAIRQQAALDAARAQALAKCANNLSSGCGDNGGSYYPEVVGVRRDYGTPGYSGYPGYPGSAGNPALQPPRPTNSPNNLPVPARPSTVTLNPSRLGTQPN